MLPLSVTISAQASPCPEAALSRAIRHRTTAGESLSTVASQYGLLPSTLVSLNPTLPHQGALATGQTVTVPPFNGTVAQVSSGQTWQSLAERYGTRADLLFEINGCPNNLPSQVFIPSNTSSNRNVPVAVPATLGYPLPAPTKVILSYGWQPHPQRDELVFNSGIAFAAVPGTEVTAVDMGTVAFVGQYNGAMMVVINHRQGLQTRYGNLENVSLTVGDTISAGNSLGTIMGESKTESFLYFEVRTNSSQGWIARDPGLYISELDLLR